MELREILSRVDHTLLAPDSTWEDVKTACDDGIRYHTATVCIPGDYVARAVSYVEGRVRIGTIAGFPGGYMTTAAKCYEATDAVHNGASEVDMVINIGRLKDRDTDFLLREIRAVKEACEGRILKVIIETCLLTDEEKILMCGIVSESGADYIKTSTGLQGGGATPHDIQLFAAHVAPHLKIKAAGGIRTLADAENYLMLGASRLGTSSIIKLIKNEEPGSY